METAEANACDDLSAARSEVSDLQGMVERQREKIVDLEKTKTSERCWLISAGHNPCHPCAPLA